MFLTLSFLNLTVLTLEMALTTVDFPWATCPTVPMFRVAWRLITWGDKGWRVSMSAYVWYLRSLLWALSCSTCYLVSGSIFSMDKVLNEKIKEMWFMILKFIFLVKRIINEFYGNDKIEVYLSLIVKLKKKAYDKNYDCKLNFRWVYSILIYRICFYNGGIFVRV